VVYTVLLLGHPLDSLARELYRYTNDQGNMVVDYQVPPEYVPRGYEILNEKGMVIEVVPRELSEEEKASRDIQVRLEEEAQAEQERLREWDETLLLRYSTIEDIEAARERALSDLRIRVSILKSNKRSLKQQVENYQAQAADQERRGQPVDVKHVTAIEDLQGEIAITESAIIDRQAEIEQVSSEYAADIERFSMLLEVVELRRSLMQNE
jgi:chemotaxis protein histidine kinase CheA